MAGQGKSSLGCGAAGEYEEQTAPQIRVHSCLPAPSTRLMPKLGLPASPAPQPEEGGRILRSYFPCAAAGRLVREPTESK